MSYLYLRYCPTVVHVHLK